ncbi:MAG TPA: sugar ABC transporter permease [Aggregatilinea sp.]|uniref:carbohydrate ABC transporter permease n=1 Tax=Aggregatilinea sp. TaxID=2806333 RepID=UPI002BAECACC|nr:sugar ABC transporter permease [Aggregatilinea sp.]HML21600.1 sugar ABC transporter permease [Aggregatilinea sp.]
MVGSRVLSGKVSNKLTLSWRDALMGYAFVAPQILGFLLLVLGPLVAVIIFSTQDRNLLSGAVTNVGLENYRFMLNDDPFFTKVLGNTVAFSAGLVPFNLALALVLALLLTQPVPGIVIFRTLFFAPVITSTVAWAVVWRFLFQGEAGINSFLALIGIDGPNWLREPHWAMVAVIFAQVIKNVGLNTLIFMAALQNIPKDYSDAASVDGANLLQRVRHITIPLLSPTIMLVLMLTLIGSLKVFDLIMLMTNGGPANATNVLVYYIYFRAFQVFQTGYASALALILFGAALVITIAQWVVRRRLVYNER